jgi:predicted amidophosphoribosyltransferase
MNERLCKNCEQPLEGHRYIRNGVHHCNVDRLAVKQQQIYYSPDRWNDPEYVMSSYEPMSNLEYLEYEYRRDLNAAPTRESLH